MLLKSCNRFHSPFMIAALLLPIPGPALLDSSNRISTNSEPVLLAQFRPDRPDFFDQGSQQFEQEINRLEQQQTNPILTVEDDLNQWQPLVLRQAGISVWIPQGVMSQENRELTTSTGTLGFSVLIVDSTGSRFVTAYSDPLTESDRANSEALFTAVTEDILENTEFELEDDRPLDLASLPDSIEAARELTLSDGDEVITFRLYLAQQRMYVLGVNQMGEASSEGELSEAAALFFESFQFLP